MADFGEWLTGEIETRGLSLRDIAVPARVSHTTVKMWSIGASRPTWENCEGLARALGMDAREVRRIAGYAEPDGNEIEQPPDVREINGIVERLSDEDRAVLLRLAQALRDSPTRRR